MPSGETVQRKQRRWGRKAEGDPNAESAAYVAAMPVEKPDRFSPPGLRPADVPRRRFTVAQPGATLTGKVRKSSWLRPTTAFDKALLAIEVAGALMVAWLAWQYIYTAYIDTGVKRFPSAVAPTKVPGVVGGKTATATPTRFAEVAPPDTGGAGGPAETPTVLRQATATALTTASPTPDPSALLPRRLRIPAMFLDSAIQEVQVDMGEWEVAPMDIGHHEGTGVPGQTGNVVLAGHRDVNSALFRELDRLEQGDEIYVSNAVGEEYKYTVSERMVVSPDHVEVMDPTGDKRVTLITCTPIGIATQRLIVVAVLDEGAGGNSE